MSTNKDYVIDYVIQIQSVSTLYVRILAFGFIFSVSVVIDRKPEL